MLDLWCNHRNAMSPGWSATGTITNNQKYGILIVVQRRQNALVQSIPIRYVSFHKNRDPRHLLPDGCIIQNNYTYDNDNYKSESD